MPTTPPVAVDRDLFNATYRHAFIMAEDTY